jgi:nitrite reductase (NADH) small subunit
MADMTRSVAIGEVAQLPKGEGRTFDVGGLRLAVFHTRSGEIFATQAACPHLGGPLADGLVGANSVICPLHDRLYDLRTGQGPEPECALDVYPTSLDADGRIWVQVPG